MLARDELLRCLTASTIAADAYEGLPAFDVVDNVTARIQAPSDLVRASPTKARNDNAP